MQLVPFITHKKHNYTLSKLLTAVKNGTAIKQWFTIMLSKLTFNASYLESYVAFKVVCITRDIMSI